MDSYEALAEFYDILNDDCDYGKWSQYLFKLLEKRGISSGKGCDLACGSGILTNMLANFGYTMTGMDISESMLNRAYGRGAGNVRFVLGDLKKFSLPSRQDFLNVTCDGVNYLRPDGEFDEFLKCAYGSIKPGGALLFDVSGEWKFKEILGNRIFADERENVTYIWQNDLSGDHIDMTFILFSKKGDAYYKSREEHRMYLYNVRETVEKLRSHGFKEISAYDAFTENAANEKSERIQFACIRE